MSYAASNKLSIDQGRPGRISRQAYDFVRGRFVPVSPDHLVEGVE